MRITNRLIKASNEYEHGAGKSKKKYFLLTLQNVLFLAQCTHRGFVSIEADTGVFAFVLTSDGS